VTSDVAHTDVGARWFDVYWEQPKETEVTTITWMAQVPTRTEEQRQADRDELLRELKEAREALEREERQREKARQEDPAATP